MADPALTDYRLEKHEQKLDVMQALLSTHVDDDHDVQAEIRSDVRVIKVQLNVLVDSVNKLSVKTSTSWDYINKGLGGFALIGFLLMAYKYFGS